jgi:site-specific recombinase XerD
VTDAREHLEKFISSKSAAGKADRTLRWYADLLGAYLDFAEKQGLSWWHTETIERFQVHLWQRGFKPNSVDCYYRAIRAWCNWLIKRKLMPAPSPMEALERPSRPSDPVPFVTLQEFTKLLRAIAGEEWTDHRDRSLLMLMFWSGLRVAEVIGLRVPDVDVAKRLVTVWRGKGGKSRLVPCAPDLGVSILAYLLSRPGVVGDVLFVSNDGYGGVRGALSVDGLRQMLRRRCSAAGLRYMHPHLFRHGFAMLFLNNGMQLSAVSAAMGHSSQKITTDIYARWLSEGLSREYETARARVERTRTHLV